MDKVIKRALEVLDEAAVVESSHGYLAPQRAKGWIFPVGSQGAKHVPGVLRLDTGRL